MSKNKKRGKWYGSYRVDQLGIDGGIVRKSRHILIGTFQDFPTKHSAKEELRRIMGSGPSKPETKLSFADLVKRWKASELPARKASTGQSYSNALKPAIAAFAQAEASAISRHDVDRLIQERAKTHTHSVLRGLKTALGIVFGYGVSNGWLEKNVVVGIKVPRSENCGGRPIERCILTPEQVQSLVEGLEEPYSTLVLLLSASGLRIGEAAGLKFSDLARGVLHVQRRIYEGKADEVKTRGSNRKVPVPEELVARIEALRRGEGDPWIFRARNGSPMNPGNWMRREVRPAAVRLGIGLTGWHDFRHFFARALRKDGTHPKTVSGLLGHSKVNLALDVYDHFDVEEGRGPIGQLLHNVTQRKEAA